jgi:U32 family peptidase
LNTPEHGRGPELLAPGGSFAAAWYALEAGADGVYLGLRDFSARKAAANFTLEQLRRILGLAAERGRAIYVTINTVVTEAEVESLADTLFRLEALAVHGVIIQDIGALSIIGRYFPGLPIHASTQMAVHDEAGLGMLAGLGVRRVVLPRELSLARIRSLHRACPDMELEVFIHGALCYSFSGVCLASHALTGRSGNRGECAQVCRSHFRGAGGEGFYFSCRDLFLGRGVLELAAAGVKALKIEGRMKSPEYVFHAVKLYREILDRGDAIPEDEYRALVRNTELTFARSRTGGYLKSTSGAGLMDVVSPGHRGARLGTVRSVRGDAVTLTLEGDLSLRDGIAVPGAGRPRGAEPYVFSVMEIAKQGKPVRFARAGDTVEIRFPREPGAPRPRDGQELLHASSRFLDLPAVKERPTGRKIPCDLELTLEGSGPHILTARLTGGFPSLEGEERAGRFEAPVRAEQASRPRPFKDVLRQLFSESGDSWFCARGISFSNHTGLADDGVFIPPSALKQAKNRVYAWLAGCFESAAAQRVRRVMSAPGGAPAVSGAPAVDLAVASHRGELAGGGPIPYASLAPGGRVIGKGEAGGLTWFALPPVMQDGAQWVEALRKACAEAPAAPVIAGLSNVTHLAFARELAGVKNLWFFVDFPLYIANIHSYNLCRSLVPKVLFQYSWIEGGEDVHSALVRALPPGSPLVRMDPAFRPPLFHSMGCFAKHVLNAGACFEGCPKDFEEVLTQGSTRFRVVVRDCVTYLLRA